MRHQGYVPLQRPPEDHSFLLIYRTCRGKLVETGQRCGRPEAVLSGEDGLNQKWAWGSLCPPPDPTPTPIKTGQTSGAFVLSFPLGTQVVTWFPPSPQGSSVILSRTWSLSGQNQYKLWSSVNSARSYLVYFCGQVSQGSSVWP